MSHPFDPNTRRRTRLFKALQGRHLHQAYLLDPQVRKDLAAEAEFGATYFDDALITPKLLDDLREQVGTSIAPRAHRLILGAPPPADVLNQGDYSSSRGTVLVVPGGMMSQLSDFEPEPEHLIWIDFFALMKGRFRDLQLGAYAGPDQEQDLRSPDVRILPDGPVPMLYDSLTAALYSDNWIPELFPYDSRKHIGHPDVSGTLKDRIKQVGSKERPVHIVTHSQGGIVARAALLKLAADIGSGPANDLIGKVIMLGPANYGSFDVALAIADSVDQIPMANMLTYPHLWAQRVLASFTAFYQLMPWDPDRVPSLDDPDSDVRTHQFWQQLTFGKIDCARLDVAFPQGGDPWGKRLDTTGFNDHFTVIVGSHPFRTTPGGVCFQGGRLKVDHSYDFDEGDGWVPDVLARIDGTPTYRADGTGHIRLPMAGAVVDGVVSILNGDVPDELTDVT